MDEQDLSVSQEEVLVELLRAQNSEIGMLKQDNAALRVQNRKLRGALPQNEQAEPEEAGEPEEAD